MKVSVCVISYNQEDYIAQTLDGILNQEADFDYEIVVSDDCSSDNTFSIIKKYKAEFPNVIRVIERSSNIGMMPNFISTLEACDGEYVAICEGDDYWIDNKKLQKQVNFLDYNLNYSMCFTRVYVLQDNEMSLISNNPWNEEKTFSIEDLAKENFINTLSVVFRNKLISKFPDWVYSAAIGDYILHMFNARKGLIRYLPELTGVYRMQTGVWSSKPYENQLIKLISVLDLMLKEDFDYNIKNIINKQRDGLVAVYCRILIDRNDFSFIDKFSNYFNEYPRLAFELITQIYPNRIKEINLYNKNRFFNIAKTLKRRIFNQINLFFK